MIPPLLLVGHGTRSADGVAAFADFVARLRAVPGTPPVEGGFLELAAPPLRDAVAGFAGAGHRHLVAVPLVLVAAGHSKGDVPAGLRREQARHPGLRFSYGRPLWPGAEVVQGLGDQLDAVLEPGLRAGTAVLLVGRGTTDPDANADVAKIGRLLWEGRGLATVETAFVSLAEPDVAAGLDRCRRLGARRIVVLPFFLFPGVLPARVAAQAADWAAAHPDTDLRVAGLLGDGPALPGLVWQRYREALDGDIRMNCDTCLYRISLPGFESRRGAPQLLHDHPDDPAQPHPHPHTHPAGAAHPGHPGGDATRPAATADPVPGRR